MGWWQPVGQRSGPLIEGLLVQVAGLTSQKVAKVELNVQSEVRRDAISWDAAL